MHVVESLLDLAAKNLVYSQELTLLLDIRDLHVDLNPIDLDHS